ncbi:MAG: alpha/beta fold hydrolase [Promethearchaeota archaeon]
MENPRKYGKKPFGVAVIHGGPGAGGEMAPIARELASERGTLEPIQTASSIEGQIEELKNILKKASNLPVILIGFSWGAWLSFLFTAKHPSFIKKLILVGSGPFEEKYTNELREARIRRLDKKEIEEYNLLINILNDSKAENKDAALNRLGELTMKTDQYNPLKDESTELPSIDYRADIFHSVWKEAAEMRRSGKLLELVKYVRCPVIAIHGDYDPHPAKGVEEPLSGIIRNFRFYLLKNCGHKPWIERQAKANFYEILKKELEVNYFSLKE